MSKRFFYLQMILAAVVLGALGWPLLFGLVYTKDDLGAFHLPTRFFYAQSLSAGDNFTWFPHLWCGLYLHGEGQVGMYHPLHFLLYSTLPLAAAFNLELLSSYPAILGGTFLFLRRLGIRRDAAMFGGLVFTFSGFNLLHHVHLNAVAIVAHIPWLLVAIDVMVRDEQPRRVLYAKLAITLLTASELLLGYPQYVYYSLFVELLYVGFRATSLRSWHRLLFLVEAKLLGVLAGGIQLLPTWDALSHSARAAPSLEFRYVGSLRPMNLVQFVAPYLFKTRVAGSITHEYGLYNGAMGSVLVVWLLIRHKNFGPYRRLATSACILGALALILASGRYGLLYSVQVHLPFVSAFRVPARYIVVLHFAMAIVAALSFVDISNLAQRCDRIPKRQLWPLTLLPILSVLVAVLSLWFRARPDLPIWGISEFSPRVASAAEVLLGPILMTSATLLVVVTARGKRYGVAAIVVFAVADQAIYGLSYVWDTWPMSIESFVRSQLLPPESSPYRVQSDFNNAISMKGVRLSGGYVGLEPEQELDYWSPGRLQAAGVRWLETSRDVSPELFARGIHWLQVPRPLARARLVSRVLNSLDPRDDIDTTDLETTALVAEELHLEDGKPGKASIVRDRPAEIDVVTTAASRQLLVLAENYHHGWEAKIDGERRRVLRVNGDFIGCVVDAGVRRVEFRFRPKSLRLGEELSAMGLGLAVLSSAVSLYCSARKPPGTTHCL
jgi:hypothetical protein